ncbi:hypothetical protein FGKAn22_23390 [Ferrigenium kumadai]|uniref:Uncharacterized protein n=1 Tax=Ferrigenium kumadai TaxID=1682490 RepID=A0AAN1T1L4_9PROT|nr:DUF6044 family protein [Ferrigenium kumadai]BBJ00647.1 hypothetical protein FGKAn22_23390 [Ferrigenium kumadai]
MFEARPMPFVADRKLMQGGRKEPRLTILHAGAICLIVAYLWPYWINGQAAFLLVHDQLDSLFVSYKILAESGMLFAHPDALVPGIGGELPRAVYPSPFFVVPWMFKLFGPFHGFVVNQLLIRFIAYWGMYRLLTKHLLTDEGSRIPVVFASVAFACLPYNSLFGLGVAGQPLYFSSLLAIRKRQEGAMDWAVCALFPAYSILALGGLFAIAVGGLIWCVDLISRRPGASRLFKALALTLAAALIVDYQMLMIVLGFADGFKSHRIEISLPSPDFWSATAAAWDNFKCGQYHVPSLQDHFILPAILGILGLVVWGKEGFPRSPMGRLSVLQMLAFTCFLVSLFVLLAFDGRMSALNKGEMVILLALSLLATCLGANNANRATAVLLWSLLAALVISLWYGYWPMLWPQVSAGAPQLPYMNLSRFHYLHPLLWYIAMAAVLTVMWTRWHIVGKGIAVVLIVLQAVELGERTEDLQARTAGDPSYQEYFSSQLFDEVSRRIGQDKITYSVVSLGLHPSIAAYNGFRTLDGYTGNYPLRYKHAFRNIIAGELDRDPAYRSYFDDWGSRFYIFSSELGKTDAAFMLTKDRVERLGVRVTDLRFNTSAFVSMGGRYVISAVRIENATNLDLVLVSTFENPASPWRIFLYRATSTLS